MTVRIIAYTSFTYYVNVKSHITSDIEPAVSLTRSELSRCALIRKHCQSVRKGYVKDSKVFGIILCPKKLRLTVFELRT